MEDDWEQFHRRFEFILMQVRELSLLLQDKLLDLANAFRSRCEIFIAILRNEDIICSL